MRTFSPGVSLRPGSLAFNRRPRRLSTSTDAFRLHPDFVRARARPGEVRRAEEFAVGAEDARGVALSPAGGKARQDDPRARPVGPSEDERAPGEGAVRGVVRESCRGGAGREGEGAFYTMVPIRPRSRGERRSLRTLPSDSLRPSLAFNTRPRRLSTPTDAFQLHPDIASCGTTLKTAALAHHGSRGLSGLFASRTFAECGIGGGGGGDGLVFRWRESEAEVEGGRLLEGENAAVAAGAR